jgi:hypothetical protein
MPAIRRRLLLAGFALVAARPTRAAGTPVLELWKSRGCTCCAAWAGHFEAADFHVLVHELDDVDPIRVELGVPKELTGCHTARVGRYVVEGHVPVEPVQRFLTEQPDWLGLAVPGMPLGSPGMEVEGTQGDPYDVIAFGADGRREVVLRVRP